MAQIQEEINLVLDKMVAGQTVIITGRKGWMYALTKTDEGFDFKGFNPADGWDKFYHASTHGHPYGAIMLIQEPSLGVPFEQMGIAGVGNEIKDRLIGMLVMDDQGRIVERFSPSNFKQKGIIVGLDGRCLTVDGEGKGHLNGVFEADKNRMHGHVGIFQPDEATDVKVLEMESLIEQAMN